MAVLILANFANDLVVVRSSHEQGCWLALRSKVLGPSRATTCTVCAQLRPAWAQRGIARGDDLLRTGVGRFILEVAAAGHLDGSYPTERRQQRQQDAHCRQSSRKSRTLASGEARSLGAAALLHAAATSAPPRLLSGC